MGSLLVGKTNKFSRGAKIEKSILHFGAVRKIIGANDPASDVLQIGG